MSKGVFGGGGGGGGEGQADIALNLTALMDILSNLLFFLLASYTAQSVEIEGDAGLKLPSSTSQLTLTPQVTVTITRGHIDVGGVAGGGVNVANIANGLIVEPLDKDGKVSQLYDRMKSLKASRAAGHSDPADAALMLLLADKGTQAQTITTVLKTSGMAGFYNVRFGVMSK
jgi:biopolymer transport protein ExbD